MNSRVKELLSNTLLFTIANMGSKLMVFLMIPLYTSVLTTQEYGISDMVQTTATLLIPILTAKIPDAILRFSFMKEYSTSVVLSIGLRIILLGCIACSVISYLLSYIPFFNGLDFYILFIPLIFASNSLVDLFHKYARGVNQVKISAYAGLIGTVSMIVLNLFFLLIVKLGIVGYLLSYFLADCIVILYIVNQCNVMKMYVSRGDNSLRTEMLKYSIPLVPNSLSWWALSSVNRYVLLAWVGTSALGIYSATLRIPSILTVLCDIFAQAWMLSALKDYGSDESKKFINAMYSRYFSLLIIMTAFIIVCSYPLAKFLLSGDFIDYWWVSPYLFVSVFWGAIVGFLGSIFSSERKNNMQFISTMVGAMVSLLITLAFLRDYGVVVIAWATMTGYYIIWLIRRIAVRKYINLNLSTMFSTLQGVILVIESYLVGKELYLYAIVCILILMLLNFRNLSSLFMFVGIESKNILLHKKYIITLW